MVKIAQKGNKVLHQKAEEVPIDEIKSVKIKNLVAKMKETLMTMDDGVAIAAPQICTPLKVFIALDDFLKQSPPSLSSGRSEKNGKKSAAKISVFINPKIIKKSAKKTLVHEGCLSVAGIFGYINRSDKVTLEAYDENGKKITRGASGLAAQIFQHEVDHLEGKLFTDNAINLKEIK